MHIFMSVINNVRKYSVGPTIELLEYLFGSTKRRVIKIQTKLNYKCIFIFTAFTICWLEVGIFSFVALTLNYTHTRLITKGVIFFCHSG